MLAALTTMGTVTARRYQDLFESLFADYEGLPRSAHYRYRDLLSGLGHCEADVERGTVSVCPAALVRLPGSGEAHAVFTGARTPQLRQEIEALPNRFSVRLAKSRNQSVRLATWSSPIPLPDVLILEADRWSDLRECAEALRVEADLEQPAAWRLSHAAGSLPRYEATLRYQAHPVLNWDEAARFDPQRLDGQPCYGEAPSLPSLVWTKDPYTRLDRHYWLEPERAAEVARDWGRWMALTRWKRPILWYDPEKRTLAVPIRAPLPSILARALTLCSGRAPDYVTGPPITIPGQQPLEPLCLCYHDVERSISDEVSKRLGMPHKKP